jgi:hypothetical protein
LHETIKLTNSFGYDGPTASISFTITRALILNPGVEKKVEANRININVVVETYESENSPHTRGAINPILPTDPLSNEHFRVCDRNGNVVQGLFSHIVWPPQLHFTFLNYNDNGKSPESTVPV